MLIWFIIKIWLIRLRESFRGIAISSITLIKARLISLTVTIILYFLIIYRLRYLVSKSI